MSSKHDRHGQHIYGSVNKAQRKRWVRRRKRLLDHISRQISRGEILGAVEPNA